MILPNLATLSRYFGRDLRDRPQATGAAALTVGDLIVVRWKGCGMTLSMSRAWNWAGAA
jgi:hypothetical protein